MTLNACEIVYVKCVCVCMPSQRPSSTRPSATTTGKKDDDTDNNTDDDADNDKDNDTYQPVHNQSAATCRGVT
jgi:hypothetical protein